MTVVCLLFEFIYNPQMGLLNSFLELIGLYTGICLAYRMNAKSLRIFISILCIATALYLFVRG